MSTEGKIERKNDVVEKTSLVSFDGLSELEEPTINGIIGCAKEAFGEGMTREEVIEHLSGKIFVATKAENVVGFGVLNTTTPNNTFCRDDISDEQGRYLVGAAVKKEFQGEGIYKEITKARILDSISEKAKLIYTRTQNPRVETGIVSVLSEFKKINLIKDFELSRLKQNAAYGRMLTKDKPEIPEHSPFVELNYEEGDAFILFFELSYGE